jgi:hypothetical protein
MTIGVCGIQPFQGWAIVRAANPGWVLRTNPGLDDGTPLALGVADLSSARIREEPFSGRNLQAEEEFSPVVHVKVLRVNHASVGRRERVSVVGP